MSAATKSAGKTAGQTVKVAGKRTDAQVTRRTGQRKTRARRS